ncbi:MAG TPA: helix-turn-helix domain-containing protein [Actinomycetales bacterium]|nr:helix-turn-helix domain-containing protein [Actinomycetales bacterium]
MPTQPRRLTDPGDLKAVAHPLRMAILETLTLHGPMTATEVGERLGESPSNCSWHLRKLAEHGFVTEAKGGTGRQRPWQSAHTGMQWDDPEPGQDADLSVAGRALTRILIDREVARLLEASERRPHDVPKWREASSITQSAMWLTADELAEVNHAITALLMAKRERLERPELRPEGSRLCAFMAWGVPNPDQMPATRAATEE